MTGNEASSRPEDATERFLASLESARPSKRLLAAIAMRRLELNSDFQRRVALLDVPQSPAEINDLQEYFAQVAEANKLDPEQIQVVIKSVKTSK